MIFDVSHRTLYRYSQPVVQSQHRIHMSPRLVPHQTTRAHSLLVEPAPAVPAALAPGLPSAGPVTVIPNP